MATHQGSSISFGALKDIRERLRENLTTSQLLTSYDDILNMMLLPLVRETTFVDTFVIRILGWQERHHRRKVSFLKRREVPRLIIEYLLSTGEDKETAFKKLYLDRGIRMQIAQAFIEDLSKYYRACCLHGVGPEEALEIKQKCETAYGTRKLFSVYSEVLYWYGKSIEFKDIIQEKYTRMTIMAARRDHTALFDHKIPLDDVVHQYFLTLSRAIDKCDSNAGTLTTHITNWFFTAREGVTRQRSMNSSPVEDRSSDKDEEGLEDNFAHEVKEQDTEPSYTQDESNSSVHAVDDILYVARIADPVGAARAYLGIPEVLKPEELQVLIEFSTQDQS